MQSLEQSPGRELSNEMLQRALTAQCIRAGIAEVTEQIAWLENRGYVKATRLGGRRVYLCAHHPRRD